MRYLGFAREDAVQSFAAFREDAENLIVVFLSTAQLY